MCKGGGGVSMRRWHDKGGTAHRLGSLAIIDPFQVPDLDLDEHVGVLGSLAAEHKLQPLIDGCISAHALGRQLCLPSHLHLDRPEGPTAASVSGWKN